MNKTVTIILTICLAALTACQGPTQQAQAPAVQESQAPTQQAQTPQTAKFEFEDLEPSAKSDDVGFHTQYVLMYEWSNDKQIMLHPKQIGGFIEFQVPTETAAPRRIIFHGTMAPDYGIYHFYVNGKLIEQTFDFYGDPVVKTGPLDLGVHKPKDKNFTMRFELVDKNPKANHPARIMGLDCLVLTEP